ncbi:MAG TPA: hypothetical protein VGH90_05195, partial [Chthoniobacteraceae bacterium]
AEKARRAHLTLGEWIRVRIAGRRQIAIAGERDAMGYPLNWFERTGGSLADVEDFCAPDDRPATPISPLDL